MKRPTYEDKTQARGKKQCVRCYEVKYHVYPIEEKWVCGKCLTKEERLEILK